MGYLRRTPVNVLTRAGVRHDVVPDTAARYADAFVAELQAFVDCVRSGTPPPVTGADSRAALAVGLAATRALREGRPVSPLKGRFFHLWGARPWMLGLPPSNSPQRGEDKAFSPPRLREDVIPRPRLLDALHHALISHSLTLLSAPAGYGKTTLLADFGFRIANFGFDPHLSAPIRNSQSEIRNSLAWLTLDEEDNDPARFLTALIAALRRLNPACGATAQTLLAGLPNPGAEARRVIGVLINDILEILPDPFVLVLDDLHLITESTVFVALDYLLEALPPQMHLAVGTRQDPPLALARLRARGQLAELDPADLHFTLDETVAFLNEKLGLGLSPADLSALQERTEGWPAGLRLLAGSLDRIPAADRTAFIQDLAQTDRYIFEFLADEVLNRQEPAVQTFLLETSILSELTPAVCQAVMGCSDAGLILEDIYRRNLFMVAVGGVSGQSSAATDHWSPITGHWQSYRYHALFQEFLRGRLAREMPERVAELHRRAAEAQADPDRAIKHYLAAEMWQPAADTIERAGWELLRQNLLDTLQGWIEALPAPVREARPRLSRFLGVCAFRKGEFKAAQSLLERAVEGFAAAGDHVSQGEALADLASSALLQGDFGRCHALTDRALTYPIPPYSRVQLLMGHAWLGIYGGRAARAQAAADLESALLDVLGAGHELRHGHGPETGETLTVREVEVLRLLAKGAGNREIAGQLIISEHTVKRHVAPILRKLDVASRTQAATRARDLRLI